MPSIYLISTYHRVGRIGSEGYNLNIVGLQHRAGGIRACRKGKKEREEDDV